MIVDSSALLSVVFEESDKNLFLRALSGTEPLSMSVVNFVEAGVRVDGTGKAQFIQAYDDLVHSAGIRLQPVTEAQAHLARRAYRAYGRGRKHPAKLNLGDCFAYALAKSTGEPLLFKGNDFIHTDIEAALRD